MTAKAALFNLMPSSPPSFACITIGLLFCRLIYSKPMTTSDPTRPLAFSINPGKTSSSGSIVTEPALCKASFLSYSSFVILNEPSICTLVSFDKRGMNRGSIPPCKMFSLASSAISAAHELSSGVWLL